MIDTVKGFSIINEAEIDVSLELPCFSHDPLDVGNLIFGFFASSKPRLYMWKFLVHTCSKAYMDAHVHVRPVYTRWHIHTCAHTQSHTHVHTLSLDPEGGGRSLKQETVPKRLLFWKAPSGLKHVFQLPHLKTGGPVFPVMNGKGLWKLQK